MWRNGPQCPKGINSLRIWAREVFTFVNLLLPLTLMLLNWGCWRRLESPLDYKEISPEYSLERMMLKLQYFGYLMWRTDSLENTLMLGKTEGRRRRGRQRMRNGWMASTTWWTWIWASSGSKWWTGKPGMLQSMWSQRVRRDWTTELNIWMSVFYPINLEN